MSSDERGTVGGAVRNVTRGAVVATRARAAVGVWFRMRGMIGRRFGAFDALIFNRCNAIHTFLMRSPIDVLFLGGDGRVLGVRRSMAPWRIAIVSRARCVVEFPPGVVDGSETREGDVIEIGEAPEPA